VHVHLLIACRALS